MANCGCSTTASVINVDPVVSRKHIGVSQPIESEWQHPYEETASAYSVYWFNNYEHRCSGSLLRWDIGAKRSLNELALSP